MTPFEAPWRGPHSRLRTIVAAAALVTAAVLVAARPMMWWPEAVIVLGLVFLLACARSVPAPREDWRPWRRPHPVRSTVSSVLGLLGLAVLLAGYAIVGVHSKVWPLPTAVAFSLLCAREYLSPDGPFLSRVFFTAAAACQWWLLFHVLTH
jgi:hypothetical protein